MKGGSADRPLIRFGAFELDLEGGELRKSGVLIHLPPQPLKVLALLAGRPAQVVTREEIRQQVWGDATFVDFEQGLNHCIKQIRTALGDDAEAPRYIQTVPRRGYRFIAPAESAMAPAPSRPWKAAVALLGAIGAAVLLILNVAGLRDRLLPKPTPPRIDSIAVLPLANLSHDPEQEHFADGMTEELITTLGQISALRVI